MYDHDVGWMTSCLGYLGIKITDRMELEELFHYDVLVKCPPHFNVTFSLPNWSSRPDRTFDVTLDDAHTSYRVFFTTITFHGDDAVTCSADTDNDDVVRAGLSVRGLSTPALTSIIIIMSVLAFGAFGYMFLDHTRRCQSSAADVQQVALTGRRARHLASYDLRRRRAIVVVRVLLRVVFALSCTFTACSLAFYTSQSQRLDDASQLSAAKHRFDVAAAATQDQLAEHVARRPADDVVRVRQMQLACDEYVGELATAVADRVAVAASTTDDDGESVMRMYQRATSRVADNVERLLADIRQWFGVQLRPVSARFRRAVRQSLHSPWLSYAHNLFNKSVERSAQNSEPPSTTSHDASFILPPETLTFAEFLRICNVDEVESWHRRFSEG